MSTVCRENKLNGEMHIMTIQEAINEIAQFYSPISKATNSTKIMVEKELTHNRKMSTLDHEYCLDVIFGIYED